MKSNEEFIAGIYRKAEIIKQAEKDGNVIAADFGKKEKKTADWRKGIYRSTPILVAAAALLLVIGRGDLLKNPNAVIDESGVMMAAEEMTMERSATEMAPDIAMDTSGDASVMRSRTMTYQMTGQVISAETSQEQAEIRYQISDVTEELKKYVVGSETLVLEETENGAVLSITLSTTDFERIPEDALAPGMIHGLTLSDGENGWYLSGLEFVLGEIASMMLLGK